jgi:hypothetical protein
MKEGHTYMSMDGSALTEARSRNGAGSAPSENGQPKTEQVVKMFMDADKIAAIKGTTVTVYVGTPPTPVVIRPLSTRGMIEAYKYLRHLLLPILTLAKNSAGGAQTVSGIMDAFGENIDDVPKLLAIILQRANPAIDEAWVLEKLDILLDLQLIIPPFLQQNGLDRMFSGKSAAPVAQSSNATTSAQVEDSQKTEALAAASTSAPTTTE